jgi:hypothetical protein
LIKLAFMFGAGPVGQRSSPLIIVLFATGANGAPPGVACDRPGHLASRSLFQGGPPNHGTPRTDNRHQPSDPRAAAAAGILFSLLLGLAITLINVSAPSNPATAGDWLTDPARRAATAVALNLVPFAGIAFLWFIGVVRDRIGQREDRFFASVFLGSGLLFVAGNAATTRLCVSSVSPLKTGHRRRQSEPTAQLRLANECLQRDLLPRPVLAAVDDRGHSRGRQTRALRA